MKTNDIIELTIDDVTREGMGVGHYDCMAIFVEDAAPGDRLSCRITKVKKSYALGKIAKIISASKSRITPTCKAFPACGGCSFCHIDYDAELKIKERWVQDALKRIGKLDTKVLPIIGAPETQNYRNKSQFPIGQDASGKISVGFFGRGSHNIVDVDNCEISSDAANATIKVIKRFILKYDLPVYSEAERTGLLRHVYVRSANGETVVTIVINGNELPHFEELLSDLQAKVSGFCGLVLNINKEDTNLVLGNKSVTLLGKDYVTDSLLGVQFHISPLSFYQVNGAQAERMYELVRKYADLKSSDTVLDLYCGIGTMALIMAKTAGKAIGIEIVPEAIEDAKLCAKLNNIENAEFICADASRAASIFNKRSISADVIIIDPPRKGCDAETLKAIIDLSPKKLIYVSCDPATLARDLKILAENGFEIIECQPLDMFPRTPHVETVVLMSRVYK